MGKTYRVGVVGCGSSGQVHHLPAYTRMAQVEAAAICDKDKELLDTVGDRFGIKDRYVDFETMLAHAGLDIVVIGTPVFTHRPFLEKALRAGCHVIIEKPIVEDMRDIDAMITLQQANDRKVMVNQNHRWLKISTTVKQVIEDGLIGEPYWLELSFFSWGVWGGFYADLEHLVLLDVGPHLVDLARYWFSADVERVYAHIPHLGHYPMTGEGFASVMLTLSGGKGGHLVESWASKCGPHEHYIKGRIEGTGGCIFVNYPDEMEVFSERLGSRVIPLVKEDDVWAKANIRVMNHLIECIEQNRTPVTDLQENRRTIAPILAAYESAAKGLAVSLAR